MLVSLIFLLLIPPRRRDLPLSVSDEITGDKSCNFPREGGRNISNMRVHFPHSLE